MNTSNSTRFEILRLRELDLLNDPIMQQVIPLKSHFFRSHTPEDCSVEHFRWLSDSPGESWCAVALDERDCVVGHIGIHCSPGKVRGESLRAYGFFDVFMLPRYRRTGVYFQLFQFVTDRFLSEDKSFVYRVTPRPAKFADNGTPPIPGKPMLLRLSLPDTSARDPDLEFLEQPLPDDWTALFHAPRHGFISMHSPEWYRWRYGCHPRRKYILSTSGSGSDRSSLVVRLTASHGIKFALVVDLLGSDPEKLKAHMGHTAARLMRRYKLPMFIPDLPGLAPARSLPLLPILLRRHVSIYHRLTGSMGLEHIFSVPTDKLAF